MKSFNLVKEIKELTESIGIKTTSISRIFYNKKESFVFSIRKCSLDDFKNKVGFNHQEKMNNLEAAINTRNRNERTRDIGYLKTRILDLIKEKPVKTLDIANNIQLTLGHTLKHLKTLEQEERIIRSSFKNKIYWKAN